MRQNKLLRQTAVGSVVTFILVTALACGRDTPPPTPSPALSRVEGSAQNMPKPVSPAVSLPQAEQGSPFDGTQGGFAVYQSRGRRDPFRSPQAQTSLMALKLTGIVRGAHTYYALIESESSPGMGQILYENDVIDAAKVVKITKDSVVFEVHMKNAEGKLLTHIVKKNICCPEKSN